MTMLVLYADDSATGGDIYSVGSDGWTCYYF